MFDKILEKAEEAMIKLSKTLSVFEQEYSRLRGKFDEQVSGSTKKVEEELEKLSKDTEVEVEKRKKQFEDTLADQKIKLAAILEQHQKSLNEMMEKDLHDFSKAVKDRFESVYAEYEVQAVGKAQASFETDVEEIFKKYGDKFAPYIFKSLIKYIFKFGRK